MTPEEVDAMKEETGLRGAELARAALAAAARPREVPPARRPAVGLPPVPPENGFHRLLAVAEEELGGACQRE